jgi:dipeptidyl aminopeptidase/acylaminoacyl peptidase
MQQPPVALRILAFVPLLGCCGAPAPHSDRTRIATEVREEEPTLPTEAQLRHQARVSARIEPILSAHENFGAVISSDGSRLLFRSDREGAAGLFLADVSRPSAEPIPLGHGPERIASASFTRDGRSVLFRQDRGRDESFHILRVDLDGSNVTDLTPNGRLWRDHPLLPAGRPDIMIYSVRTATDPGSSLVVQSLAQGEPRVVYTDPVAAAAVDVTADGSRALMIRETPNGRDLIEVEIESGTHRPLTTPDGLAGHVKAAAYAADGLRVYVASAREGEAFALRALELTSLREVARYSPPSAAETMISSIVVSPRGDHIAIDIGSGDHSTVRILDATTLALPRDVQTPLGSVSVGLWTEIVIALNVGAFTDDGRSFVVGLSQPERPSDVYLVDAESGAIVPLRDEPRVGLDALEPMSASIGRVPSFDGASIPINLYLPGRIDEGRKLPVVFWLHGGPDQHAEIAWNVIARAFTTSGYVFVEPNIRGSSGFGRAWEVADDRELRADAMRDLESLATWARAQSWCDGDRLVIAGASFGGYYTLMGLTRQRQTWRAGIDVAGVADLRALLTSSGAAPRYAREFGDPVTELALIDAFDPMRDIDSIESPLFVYHGHNDGRVPRRHADAVIGRLRARGADVEYMMLNDEGHTIALGQFLPRAIRFLNERLGLPLDGQGL